MPANKIKILKASIFTDSGIYRNILIFSSLAVISILTLFLVERVNYLLFHTLIELFSVVVAFSLFVITLNARRMLENNYLLIFGIAAFFIGLLDLMHVLTYSDMNIIVSDRFYANQFWIATRGLESLTLLTGFLFLSRNIKPYFWTIFLIYMVITAGIILSILVLNIFPLCYIEGVGQTPFKIYSEYAIISILLLSLALLISKKAFFEKDIFRLIALSIVFTILSEYMFTLYYSNFGLFNQLGHYFKLASFLLIYKANIEMGFVKPNKTIYNSLVKSQEDIDEFNKQLREQIATRDRFFSIIAHDLRSPLASIIMASEVMHKKVQESNSDQFIRRYTDNIYNISKGTFTLLENLLEWSRFKSGAITVNPVDFRLNEMISRVLSLYHQTAENKDIDLKAELTRDFMVRADIDMINTVLRNLVSNALKFTNPGGKVIVTTQSEENYVKVMVSDNGTGIKAKHLDKLFEIENVHSERGTANEKGTGLGLLLCREFIEANDGRISASSKPGQGSTFTFTVRKSPKTHH